MTRLPAGAAVVECLRQEEVTHVFGLIGTGTMEVLDALHGAEDIRYVGVRHEQNAVHMADGYARIRGRAGVAMGGQAGPGATNLVTGLAQASLAFSPVVALAGSPSTTHFDTGTFQEVDQQALFSAVTKRTWTVQDAPRIPYYVQQAFRVAESGRRGPVVLNLPSDVLGREIEFTALPPERTRAMDRPAASEAAIARAASLLGAAERPLIVAGAGVKWARGSASLAALAERLEAPVAASAGNADVLPNDHPLYAGQVGPRGNLVATELARSADVILALGTRLGFNTTFFSTANVSPDARIIQVDIEPSAVGRHFPVELGIVADAGEFVAGLLAAIERTTDHEPWVRDFQARRAALLASRAQAATNATPLLPATVCAAAQRVLPRDTIVTIDTGTCAMQATDVIQTFVPPSFLTPLDFGLVGFAYAAGLGAKAAAPERPVLSIMGDGGFGMALTELGTAVAAGLPTVTLVMDNGAWGAEKAYQRDFYDARFEGADLVNPRFDAVAEAYGAVGLRAETPDDITTAVEEGLRRDVPTVIWVPVDPTALISLRRDAFAHRSSGGDVPRT